MNGMNWLALAALVALPVGAAAQVTIGMLQEECHTITLSGPAGRVAEYEKLQAERFAGVDPAAVAKLRAGGVQVNVALRGELSCFPAGVPQKLVLTAEGQRVPVLVIPLSSAPVAMSNALGAQFAGYVGYATVDAAKLVALGVGKGYDLHLVTSTGAEKYWWDEGTIQELGLKP